VALVSIEDILASLTARIHHHRLARRADDLWIEERNRAELGSLVEALLAAHLRRATGWSPGAWIDMVVPGTLDVSETGVAVVSGAAVWCGDAGWFLEPLAARFELSSDGRSVRTYELRFGDAELGLGAMRHQPLAPPSLRTLPERWCFVFEQRV
jgi:hypothetical protein